MTSRAFLSSCLLALLTLLPAAALADTQPSADDLLRLIDKRLSFTSDYKGVVRIREIRKDGQDRLVEINVYRRDKTRDLVFLTTKPKHMAGSGYLRISNNLWEYNPTVGQWERTTVRANIAGTFTCESDFDRSRLAEDYTAKDEGVEKLNGTSYRKLYLTAKSGAEVPFPLLRIWVDPDNNLVKRIGYAPSGKTLRTDTIRAYQRIKDPESGQQVYHYKEVIEEEAESGMKMVVRYEDVQLAPLDANIFTKSWLEARAR
ncbi:MAG TPA: outer membrane lipoprotein-sorting protein [Archangium sp.]|uniref:outer membrane lipoprotein-sorting protein n=1 Tax=Archangium sp. TaxID=1872627 RepID=UPI002E311AD2|nr:outer membrane lipoprotein-sorting protein [Archangium sp.]HEX5744907.1 outer membrane lipoprotein-sorting protein [Archangium sp.]